MRVWTPQDPQRENIEAAVKSATSVVVLGKLDEGTGKPIHVGTGVLVNLRGIRFIITASHCIERAIPRLFAVLGGKVVLLKGRMLSTGDNPRTKQYDIGAIELQPDEVALLREGQFIQEQDLDLTTGRVGREYIFTVFGYLLRKGSVNTANFEVNYPGNAYISWERGSRIYTKLSVDPEVQLLLHRSRKRSRALSTSSVGPPPSLRGASGGAIWRLHLAPAAVVRPKLSGIFLGLTPKDGSVLRATRIISVLILLVSYYPSIDGIGGLISTDLGDSST